MKVYACPAGYEEPKPDYRNYDHKKEAAAEVAHQERLKQHLIESGYTGRYTGGIVSFGVADGAALYMLADGNGTYGPSFLIHLAYGDGYSYNGIQHFPKKDIIARIEQSFAAERRQAMAKDWWEQRKLGEIVHYENRTDQYVRGEIVQTDEGKAMKCIALVGNWASYDLPRRMTDGTVLNSYHVKQVLEGETMKPHESSMFESRGPRGKNAIDPTKLSPVSLDLPEMTAAEQETARVEKLRQRAIEILNEREHNTTPTADTIKAQLRAAIKVLEAGDI